MSLNRGVRGGQHGGGGPPGWMVMLIVIALVMGGFYLLQGAQNFLRTGGLGVQEATARAGFVNTATAVRVTRRATQPLTALPTATPIPECVDFRVVVPNAIVRESPSPNAALTTSFSSGEIVCVLGRAPENTEWYMIDEDTATRRRELAYMHETVIDAVNPTPTPSRTPLPSITPTPLPSVTPLPVSVTPTPAIPPTAVPDARSTLPMPANSTLTPSPIPTVLPSSDSTGEGASLAVETDSAEIPGDAPESP